MKNFRVMCLPTLCYTILCFLLLLPTGQANIVYNPPPVDKKKVVTKKKKTRKRYFKSKTKFKFKKPLKERKLAYVNSVDVFVILSVALLFVIVGALLLIFGFPFVGSFIVGIVLLGLAELALIIATLITLIEQFGGRDLITWFFPMSFHIIAGLIFGCIFLVLVFSLGFPMFLAWLGFLILGIPILMLMFFFIGRAIQK